MEVTEKTKGRCAGGGGEGRALIPGLPDEIAMECLVRVSCQFHSNMKSVCHSWRSLISSPLFYRERIKSGAAEHLVCLIQPMTGFPPPDSIHGNQGDGVCGRTEAGVKKEEEEDEDDRRNQQQGQCGMSIYNETRGTWHRIRPKVGRIPMFCQCLALGSSGKLMLLGGWDPVTLEPVADVYILDLVSGGGRWRRAAPMSVPRSFFACAVVSGTKVYVAGGHDDQKNALRSAEVYDVEEDRWEMLPDMAEERDECQGLSWDGDSRFWVVSGYGTERQGEFGSDAECYDPETGSWYKVEGVWPFSRTSPRGCTAAVSSGQQRQWWWFLGSEQEEQQQHEEAKEKPWKTVSTIKLSRSIIGTPPCVTNLAYGTREDGHRVFVMSSRGGGGGDNCGGGCEGETGFIMERERNGNTKWNHVHTPMEFSGFPFSASSFIV
ncbi:hypothetical protein SLEP1_g6030 [Rubroshorea leprosula]|uniref:F-box domain-containing protein n=1 Tax=Rubroshorea leprosula TaxID=152421 RepID=A0AAV5HZQ2_9ROSI|nr:hypothetical protein SLEP1_g6030 [Rubroshorea leprosula]